jgi:DNA-binding NarL/FixJ family response regulator
MSLGIRSIEASRTNHKQGLLLWKNAFMDVNTRNCVYDPFYAAPISVPSLKVVLVEDSPVVRERVAESLRKIDGVELIGEFEDASTAIGGIRNGAPDVVLLDIKLRGSSGMEVMHYIEQSNLDVKVIILSNYAEPQYRELFLRRGAHAVLDKSHEFHRVEELLLRLIDPP